MTSSGVVQEWAFDLGNLGQSSSPSHLGPKPLGQARLLVVATSCSGFTVTAGCDPLTGSCRCTLQGPLGVDGDATVEVDCHTEQPTNKWCISQPFGCCDDLF